MGAVSLAAAPSLEKARQSRKEKILEGLYDVIKVKGGMLLIFEVSNSFLEVI
jgi:hypothetical protein